jgi:hypothetical protein
MKLSEIKTANYNPRKMSKEAREALKTSLETFDDISGIVVNKRTGNIISGNHRYEQLVKMHGRRNLSLTELTEDYSSLDAKKKPTGFLIRFVDWDEGKERAANITANNDLLQGEFTQGLQDVLAELSDFKFDDSLFEGLRLDELQIDLNGVDEDLEWSEDAIDKIQQEAEDRNAMLDDPKDNAPSEVKEILAQIKITVPDELKDQVKQDVLEYLAGQHYYGLITIV